MMDEIRQTIIEAINNFLQRDLLAEAIALVLILLSGFILARVLKYILKRIEHTYKNNPNLTYAPWLRNVFELAQMVVKPLSLWLAGKGIIHIMGTFDLPHGILDYLLPFVGLWLVYRLLSGIIIMALKPNQIQLWQNQILRPTFILLTLMHVVGLLGSILNYQINLGKGIVVTVGALLGGLVVLYIFVLLGRYVRGLLRDVILPRMETDPSIIPIVATFSGYLVIILGVVVGLIVAGVDLTSFAVILGGLSVGLGFGMREIVNNFVSGFILLFERSLTPGDVIHTSSVNGIVEDIKLRSTRIRTDDNVQLIVPNGKLLGDVLANYSHREGQKRKRINIPLAASPNDNPQEVMAALVATAVDHPHILEKPTPEVLLTAFSGSSFEYILYAWVANTNEIDAIASELRLKILDMFTVQQYELK